MVTVGLVAIASSVGPADSIDAKVLLTCDSGPRILVLGKILACPRLLVATWNSMQLEGELEFYSFGVHLS